MNKMVENPGIKYISKIQESLYSHLNQFANSNPDIARLGALPIAVIDVILEVTKCIVDTVVAIALKIHSFFRPEMKLQFSNGLAVDIPLTVGYTLVSPFFIFRKAHQIFNNPISVTSTRNFPYDNAVPKHLKEIELRFFTHRNHGR